MGSRDMVLVRVAHPDLGVSGYGSSILCANHTANGAGSIRNCAS